MTVIGPSEEKYLSTLLIFISISLLKLSFCPKMFFFLLPVLIFPLTMFIACTSGSSVFCCFHMITCSFLFSHTWKIATALHDTCCASAGVNLPGSIFQFTQAEMSFFGTDPTCSDLDQIAAGPGVWFLPCVERGKIRTGPQEPSFKISGLFASTFCCLHYWFCRSCHFKPYFKHLHVCIYMHTCVKGNVWSCMLG